MRYLLLFLITFKAWGIAPNNSAPSNQELRCHFFSETIKCIEKVRSDEMFINCTISYLNTIRTLGSGFLQVSKDKGKKLNAIASQSNECLQPDKGFEIHKKCSITMFKKFKEITECVN